MASSRSARGQTLVELVLVLPCFCLGIFMGVQLICYCHNMIELQRIAQIAVDKSTDKNYRESKRYSLFNSLWGNFTMPHQSPLSDGLRTWKKANGFSVYDAPGKFCGVDIRIRLLPGTGFSKVLPAVTQTASAETFLEPALPEEN